LGCDRVGGGVIQWWAGCAPARTVLGKNSRDFSVWSQYRNLGQPAQLGLNDNLGVWINSRSTLGAAAILTAGVGSSGAVVTVRVGVHPVKTRTPALTEIGIAYRERVTNIRLTANPFPVFPLVTL